MTGLKSNLKVDVESSVVTMDCIDDTLVNTFGLRVRVRSGDGIGVGTLGGGIPAESSSELRMPVSYIDNNDIVNYYDVRSWNKGFLNVFSSDAILAFLFFLSASTGEVAVRLVLLRVLLQTKSA